MDSSIDDLETDDRTIIQNFMQELCRSDSVFPKSSIQTIN
jgi:hypothetical protein